MKRLKNTAFALLALITVTSCSKYEEGPAISFVSKVERVSNDWEIEKAEQNGENVTEEYDQYELYLNDDYTARLVAVYSSDNITFEYETDGTWEFEEDKEILKFDFDNDDADNEYIILKLKTDELWLENTEDGTELHLEPMQ